MPYMSATSSTLLVSRGISHFHKIQFEPYRTDDCSLTVSPANPEEQLEKTSALTAVTFCLCIFISKCSKTFVFLTGHLQFQVFLSSITNLGVQPESHPSELPSPLSLAALLEVLSVCPVVGGRRAPGPSYHSMRELSPTVKTHIWRYYL